MTTESKLLSLRKILGPFTQDAQAHLHAKPLMLLASCVNTPIDHNVFHYLRMLRVLYELGLKKEKTLRKVTHGAFCVVLQGIPVEFEFLKLVEEVQKKREFTVMHGPVLWSGNTPQDIGQWVRLWVPEFFVQIAKMFLQSELPV